MRNSDEVNQAAIWNEYAGRGYLQSTIDPRDEKGLKCDYIDKWARYYLKRYILVEGVKDVLEIGSGSGRNLFFLSPAIRNGYGIDIAEEQVGNAVRRRGELHVTNVEFFTDPNAFLSRKAGVDCVFTMWVLAGYESDEGLLSFLAGYRERLGQARRFVFFEQAALEEYTVNESGRFYKKVRTLEGYRDILARAGLRVSGFRILNEKGYGPLYRLLYMSPLYRIMPGWLRLNWLLFPVDRLLVRRKIGAEFTDCVFICERAVASTYGSSGAPGGPRDTAGPG